MLWQISMTLKAARRQWAKNHKPIRCALGWHKWAVYHISQRSYSMHFRNGELVGAERKCNRCGHEQKWGEVE